MVYKFNKSIKQSSLAFENLFVCGRQIKPSSTIDLGKGLYPSSFWRPFHLKSVALDGMEVEIAFDRERSHPLAPTLTNIAQRFKRTRDSDACLF